MVKNMEIKLLMKDYGILKYKETEEFKKEIQGRDISRYMYTESFQYVKYGKWLAGYVDKIFFYVSKSFDNGSYKR